MPSLPPGVPASGTSSRRTPKGSYVNGTWSQLPSMPGGYNPLYFASAILPDGRMIVEGGEYLGGTPTWTNKGAIYNPVTNKWRSVAPPLGWTNIGDAQSNVLANGTFILSQACQNCTTSSPILTSDAALFNATGRNWLTIPGQGKNDPNDEESWTLERATGRRSRSRPAPPRRPSSPSRVRHRPGGAPSSWLRTGSPRRRCR